MRKILMAFILVLFMSTTSCVGVTTVESEITSTNETTTEFVDEILDLPFLTALDLPLDMINGFDTLLNGRILYLSDDIMIYPWAEDEEDLMFSGENFIRVNDGTINDYSIGRSRLEYLMGFDATNNVVYYNSQDSVKHSGDFSEENEINFYGDLKYIGPNLFAYGNGIYDYLGNNLTEEIDGVKVIYRYAMGENLVYHAYNYKETSDETCTIETYQLGNDQMVKSQALADGYKCGSVQYSNYHYAIIDVYDGAHQVGYISIDKNGIIRTFYAEDYLPDDAMLELFEPFGETSTYLYFKYKDALDDSYYMMTDLGVTNVISHYKATDFLYLDEEIFIRESDLGYKFIRDLSEEYMYIPQSGSMTVQFNRVDDYIIINDIGVTNLTSFYSMNTKEIEFHLDGYFYGIYGNVQNKIVYLSDTFHIYDLDTSFDIDLGLADTFKYVDNRYFILYNEDVINIVDTDTNQIYEMDKVAVYTTDSSYTHNDYAFVGFYRGTYYVIG